MTKTTLAIMAAGLGSRFGEGIKQLTPVGPGGEIIIDYSIYDAIEAGFDEVLFIIRKDHSHEICLSGAFRSAGRIFTAQRKDETLGNGAGSFGSKRTDRQSFCSD